MCSVCHRPLPHHSPTCFNAYAISVRRELVLKHGIDPAVFQVFLDALAKKYEGRSIGPR
jgi:hypothetical protein